LTAVGSGKRLRLSEPGVATLLVCFAQETQKDIAAPELAVRQHWPEASAVLVAHVIHLKTVPSMFRKIAEGILGNEHRKAVEALLPGQAAEDYVVMLPDWQGEAAAGLAIEEPSRTMTCVVLDPEGRIAGRFTGAGREAEIVSAIEQAIAR
jgi:hypothetical protein